MDSDKIRNIDHEFSKFMHSIEGCTIQRIVIFFHWAIFKSSKSRCSDFKFKLWYMIHFHIYFTLLNIKLISFQLRHDYSCVFMIFLKTRIIEIFLIYFMHQLHENVCSEFIYNIKIEKLIYRLSQKR